MMYCIFIDYVIDVGIKKYYFIKKICNICFVFVNYVDIFIFLLMKKCKCFYFLLKIKWFVNFLKGLKC